MVITSTSTLRSLVAIRGAGKTGEKDKVLSVWYAVKGWIDEKYQVVKTLNSNYDKNDAKKKISGYKKLDDVQKFLEAVGVKSKTAPSSVKLSDYGISKKADDVDELYIIPEKDANGDKVAGKYFLVNTSGTVVKSKSRNKDGNDYYYCVNNSGNIIAIYTEK